MRTSPSDRTSDTPRTRVIKRYANRKLYDTRDSRYVTLQQIAEHVRAGEEVTIIDNTTKEDLTNVTLAQIVYEEERRSEGDARRTSPAFDTLRNLIQNGGERFMTTLREGPMGKLMPTPRKEDGPQDEKVELRPELKETKVEGKPETKEVKETRAAPRQPEGSLRRAAAPRRRPPAQRDRHRDRPRPAPPGRGEAAPGAD